MKTPCSGIIGKILGHKLEHIYDIDKRPVKSEDLASALSAASSHNFWNYANQLNPNDIPKEQVTKVYRHSICSRCGLTVNVEKITL